MLYEGGDITCHVILYLVHSYIYQRLDLANSMKIKIQFHYIHCTYREVVLLLLR